MPKIVPQSGDTYKIESCDDNETKDASEAAATFADSGTALPSVSRKDGNTTGAHGSTDVLDDAQRLISGDASGKAATALAAPGPHSAPAPSPGGAGVVKSAEPTQVDAATKIQTVSRTRAAKRKTKKIQKEASEDGAAQKIQGRFRIKTARRTICEKKRERLMYKVVTPAPPFAVAMRRVGACDCYRD